MWNWACPYSPTAVRLKFLMTFRVHPTFHVSSLLCSVFATLQLLQWFASCFDSPFYLFQWTASWPQGRSTFASLTSSPGNRSPLHCQHSPASLKSSTCRSLTRALPLFPPSCMNPHPPPSKPHPSFSSMWFLSCINLNKILICLIQSCKTIVIKKASKCYFCYVSSASELHRDK